MTIFHSPFAPASFPKLVSSSDPASVMVLKSLSSQAAVFPNHPIQRTWHVFVVNWLTEELHAQCTVRSSARSSRAQRWPLQNRHVHTQRCPAKTSLCMLPRIIPFQLSLDTFIVLQTIINRTSRILINNSHPLISAYIPEHLTDGHAILHIVNHSSLSVAQILPQPLHEVFALHSSKHSD